MRRERVNNMNILAIDYGAKRIGLAWVNTDIGVVLPFGQIINPELITLIQREGIDKIVVGLPLGLNGKENKGTERVRGFVEDLKKYIAVSIEFIDERFSSAEADRMEGGGASRDEKAAMIILQTYLDRKK